MTEPKQQQEEDANEKKRNAMDAFTDGNKKNTDAAADDEKLCRFCFDGETKELGSLIAPCDCKGGQKYIHLSCLRQWQRMVLISQPTHPDFWEDDIRHRKCNVCKGDFTCEPPTRQELMLGFTGPEIAALIEPNCIIASHEGFNRIIEEQISSNPLIAIMSSSQNWLRGVYLITKVEEDTGEVDFPLERPSQLEHLRDMVNDDLTWESPDGTEYCLQAEGSLSGKKREDKHILREFFFEKLVTPCRVVFRPINPLNNNCADDKVTAVNLTRPFLPSAREDASFAALVNRIIGQAKAAMVDVTYYRGGPCDDESIVSCLVLGGRRTGYTIVHHDFRKALLFAKRNAIHAKCEGRNNIAVGQYVVLTKLSKCPELNGHRGLVQAYDEKEGRFEVRLLEGQQQQQQQQQQREAQESSNSSSPPSLSNNSSSEANIKRVKPINLMPHPSGIGANGTVFVFVGDARWTRAQLLGEIAKSSWGLCQARTSDLFVPADERYNTVHSRLVYAPVSEMSQEYATVDNMVSLRRGAMEAAQYVNEEVGQ